MPIKNMRSALGNSLKAEEEAVKNRFERAETILARNDAASLTAAVSAAGPETYAPPSPPDEEPRVKRDSFTMPLADYEQIATLQKRCLRAQVSANKSEILRAGLAALAALSDEDLAIVVEGLVKVKTGRRPLTNGHTV